MFGKKKRAPQPRGQGAAAAKQMGLFVDLDSEEMMGMEGNLEDPDLEAELAAITGNKAAAGGRAKQKGKSALPMEDIAKMADECMRDLDDDEDDSNLEDDEDLLAELQEVVGEEEAEEAVTLSSRSSATAESPQAETPESLTQDVKVSSAAPGSLQHTLEERVAMYRTALQNAKTAEETSKARRFDRGLKTLQSMVAAVKKGKPVNEAEIPPPVSSGAPSAAPPPPAARRPPPPVPSPPEPCPSDQEGGSEVTTPPPAVPEIITPSEEEQSSSSLSLSSVPSPEEPADRAQSSPSDANEATKTLLLERQKEYKMAALRAKKQGDVEQARLHLKNGKRFDVMIEALEKGQAVDLSELPPSPDQAAAPPSAPKDVLEALEQRRAKYSEASNQAKAAGDDRKARMHDRIAKQYQSAIRSHKAGKATKRAEHPKKLMLDVSAAAQERRKSPTSPEGTAAGEGLSATAEFLEGRKKQYMKAALQAKQKSDMDQAKTFLRTAKSLEPLIEAARSGRTVDISTVPSPPGDEDEDFILVHHSDVQISEKAEQLYAQLAKILKEQYEKCMTHSKQFTHLGNVTETTKRWRTAVRSLEVLKLAQSKGLPPPKHHFEERSFHTVRMFPELSSTDMVVVIPNDLDAFIKFDFPYPSAEQPQKHRTAVIKNTNSPEYKQSFTLSINRNHRGFRRLVTTKGLKLELLHKGGFLRSDKPVGTALLKLEKLESQSEIREIVEVMDGRKPTGGRVEVKVRLREPLSGQDMQSSTERWLVIDSSQALNQKHSEEDGGWSSGSDEDGLLFRVDSELHGSLNL
ncbi:hypothetical protein F7725_011166 [Dissostichus mawsoni]|uniref:C2 domain-containing protein n=1 Tax=Dissostichus mawsoni TaxID=36200 RepID=A0A7J5Z896_DISMA|nr:hypothetical protein F7725_011166 [Dissostichus mawsoni]